MRTFVVATCLLALVCGFSGADSTRPDDRDRRAGALISSQHAPFQAPAFLDTKDAVVTSTVGYAPGNMAGHRFGDAAWEIDLGVLESRSDLPVVGIADGIVVFQAEKDGRSRVTAVDAASGKEKWTWQPSWDGRPGWGYLCGVEAGAVYVYGDQKVACLDIKTGKEKWSTSGSPSVTNAWLTPEGVLARAKNDNGHRLLQLHERKRGKEQWKEPVRYEPETGFGDEFQVLARAKEILLVSDFGTIDVLDSKKGTIKRLRDKQRDADGGYKLHVFCADLKAGLLSASAYDLEIFSTTGGKPSAHRPVYNGNQRAGNASYALPVTDGKEVVSLDCGLVRILDATTLKCKAVRYLHDVLPNSQLLTDDAVIVASAKETFVLNRSDLGIRQRIGAARLCLLGGGFLLTAQSVRGERPANPDEIEHPEGIEDPEETEDPDETEDPNAPVATKLICYPIVSGDPTNTEVMPTPQPPKQAADWSNPQWTSSTCGYQPAWNPDGNLKQKWEVDLEHRPLPYGVRYPGAEGGPTAGVHPPVPLAATGGVLLSYAATGGLEAFSESDGKRMWSLRLPEADETPPRWQAGPRHTAITAWQGRFYVERAGTSSPGVWAVWCIDAATGAICWISAYQGWRMTEGQNLIMVGPGIVARRFGGALHPDTGEALPSPERPDAHSNMLLVAADSKALYYVLGLRTDYKLKAWDIAKAVWQWEKPLPGMHTAPYYVGVVTGEHVILPSYSGVTAYSRKDGSVAWELKDAPLAQPLYSGSLLAVNTAEQVALYNVRDGKPVHIIKALAIHGTNEKVGLPNKYLLVAMTDETLVWEWNGSVVVTTHSGEALIELENAQFQALGTNLTVLVPPDKPVPAGGRAKSTIKAYR